MDEGVVPYLTDHSAIPYLMDVKTPPHSGEICRRRMMRACE